MTETKDTAADVIEFVGRGVRAQCCVDAAVLGSHVGLMRAELMRAAAACSSGDHDVVAFSIGASIARLDALALALASHFERFAK